MACRLIGAKPLSEPMLDYCWSDPRERIWKRIAKWWPVCLSLNVLSWSSLCLQISWADTLLTMNSDFGCFQTREMFQMLAPYDIIKKGQPDRKVLLHFKYEPVMTMAIAVLLDGAKPLPEPMLTSYQKWSVAFMTWEQSHKKLSWT